MIQLQQGGIKMDFLTDQKILSSSQRYSSIYDHFRENYNIKTAELFLICMAIGFHKGEKIKREDKGSEFRSNYFSTKQRASFYSIVLTDPELGKEVERFNDSDFQLKAVRTVEDYAEAGMTTLVEEVFMQKWDGNKLDETYKEYEVDILSYIYNLTDETPF